MADEQRPGVARVRERQHERLQPAACVCRNVESNKGREDKRRLSVFHCRDRPWKRFSKVTITATITVTITVTMTVTITVTITATMTVTDRTRRKKTTLAYYWQLRQADDLKDDQHSKGYAERQSQQRRRRQQRGCKQRRRQQVVPLQASKQRLRPRNRREITETPKMHRLATSLQ